MVQIVALLNSSDSDTAQNPKPRSARRVVAQVLGGVVLLLSGVAIGRQHPSASLRGSGLSLIGEAINSRTQFQTAYHAYTAGMAPGALSATNTAIYGATAPTAVPAALIALNKWYTDVGSGVDQEWVQQMTNTAFVNAALPAAPAVAPVKTADEQTLAGHSYSEFGHLFSQETVGKTWAEIGLISATVQAVQVPVGTSAVLQRLNGWYHSQLTDMQRKQFAESMVQMQSGINAR